MDVVPVKPKQRAVVQRQLSREVDYGLVVSREHDELFVAVPHAQELPPDVRVEIFLEGLRLAMTIIKLLYSSIAGVLGAGLEGRTGEADARRRVALHDYNVRVGVSLRVGALHACAWMETRSEQAGKTLALFVSQKVRTRSVRVEMIGCQ